MKSIIKMLAVFMVVAMFAVPVLGEMSIAEGTAYASEYGASVTVSGYSTTGDAQAGAISEAIGSEVFAQVSAYAGPGEDEDSTVAGAETSAVGMIAYSGAGASVDCDCLGYVSVTFDALALGDAETSAGAVATVQDDEISAVGGAQGSGFVAMTFEGNNVYAESYDEDANIKASMVAGAEGYMTVVEVTGTGGEGWLNFDGSAFAEGFYAGIFGEGGAQITEED